MAAKQAHVVMGAGGVRCMSFIGALKAMASENVRVASISCASAGTLIGALFAAGLDAQTLEKFLQEIDFGKYQGSRRWLYNPFAWPFARYSESGLPQLFVKILGRDPTLGELRIPFATIALDLFSSKLLVYASETQPDMKISEVLEIALAVPGLYPPVERGGRMMIDGALASMLPVWLATWRKEPLPILVLDTGGISHPGRPRGIKDYLYSVLGASIAGRDDVLIEGVKRAHRVAINCGDIPFDQFAIDSSQKIFLLEAGHRAMHQLLRYEDWASKEEGGVPEDVNSEANEHDKAAQYGEQIIYNFFAREITMGHVIKSGAQSIINVESNVGDITQTIGNSNNLSKEEKTEWHTLLLELNRVLEKERAAHADEVALIEKRLGDLVGQVDKQVGERKESLIRISASGLKEAAGALADIMPGILPIAGKIAALAAAMLV